MAVCEFCFVTVKHVYLFGGWSAATNTPAGDAAELVAVECIPLADGHNQTGYIAAERVPVGRNRHRLVGYLITEDHPVRPGYRAYAPHIDLCEQVAPNHPNRPARPVTTLF